MKKNLIHDMVEIAMLVSIAIVLDKFAKIPIGIGSINISMLMLFIISFRHGPIKGFVSGGIIYGLICCLTDGYGLITYPLEYFIAYGSIFILGLFSKRIIKYYENNKYFKSYLVLSLSILGSLIIRFICGVIDSILIYEYELMPAIIYNLPYVFISGIIVIILMIILLPLIMKINNKYKTGYLSH